MMNRTPARRRRATVIIGLAVMAVVAVAVLGGAWLARAVFDSQWTLTLHDVMSSEPDAEDPTTDPIDVTASTCSADIPCVEAYSTAEATYLRFGSRDAAAQHLATLQDGFQSNYIVMDFAGRDHVSKTQQLWAMQHLAGLWQDYEGEFPDR